MTISIRLNGELKFLKPLTKYLDPKLLLDNYTSLFKSTSSKLESEIDVQILTMLQSKYKSDLSIFSN